MRLHQGVTRLEPTSQHHGAAPARRLRRGERRRSIIETATGFFAKEGFQGSTRALAAQLGVTQALLYRYFRSKEDLVVEVFGDLAERVGPLPVDGLAERGRPLETRLGELLTAYANALDPITLRLQYRAALDGIDAGRRLVAAQREQVVPPVVSALRGEFGLPDLDAQPMLTGERELAIAPFGSVAYFVAREHIFGADPPAGTERIAHMYARIFVDGARNEMPNLHRLDPDDVLGQRAPTRDEV